MRKADIYCHDVLAGTLVERNDGLFVFEYNSEYCYNFSNKPISLTMPVSQKKFESKILFPFFDGLIPEGWLLEIGIKKWKLNPRDRMGVLLEFCEDCIGAVSIRRNEDDL